MHVQSDKDWSYLMLQMFEAVIYEVAQQATLCLVCIVPSGFCKLTPISLYLRVSLIRVQLRTSMHICWPFSILLKKVYFTVQVSRTMKPILLLWKKVLPSPKTFRSLPWAGTALRRLCKNVVLLIFQEKKNCWSCGCPLLFNEYTCMSSTTMRLMAKS